MLIVAMRSAVAFVPEIELFRRSLAYASGEPRSGRTQGSWRLLHVSAGCVWVLTGKFEEETELIYASLRYVSEQDRQGSDGVCRPIDMQIEKSTSVIGR
jgi:hypothetical protein